MLILAPLLLCLTIVAGVEIAIEAFRWMINGTPFSDNPKYIVWVENLNEWANK
jgi:hypothetical protein